MIPIAEPVLGEEELANVTEAVKSGWISSKGKFILEFEEGFARYCGVRHGVATSNGTVALHLALAALDIGFGDEVIVPTLTFVATANAVRYTGAKPVFVDSHPDYWCIDPEKIEKAITPQTKAIIPVHLYGHPCDMDAIMTIAREHHLYVVEDAAEAHGAECKGKKVGSFGDINCFSFYANKIITTGEGGMCLTSSDKLASKMRILRDHGMSPSKRYWHDRVGFNYRMTNMQAAVGVAQLKKLDHFIEKKREIATTYNSLLASVGGLSLPPEMPWAKNVYWMYSVLVGSLGGSQRNELIGRLGQSEIESRPFFYPVHLMPPYDNRRRFSVAEGLSRRGINLPSGNKLSKEDLKSVAKEVSM
ncbi:MAG: DegT/DnrJ/EryC1/StrS family aminotransferase [Dehalococcoidia bacterium]|nr:DegT/DnrJ/EryC1/StrS family aminotransferase [Dehalococcoidia bacterium]